MRLMRYCREKRKKPLSSSEELAFSSLSQLLRPPREDSYALGYNTNLPPPLFQAEAPGIPDLSRPVLHTDRDTSQRLLEAVRRTFPLPELEETVEVHEKPPFRTAFSKPLATTPPPMIQHPRGEGDRDDVLPYVAFGPLPDTALPPRSKSEMKKCQTGKAKLPKEPLYETMARQWEKLEDEVFVKERAYREKKKIDQQRRLKHREERLAVGDTELQHRREHREEQRKEYLTIKRQAEDSMAEIREIESQREQLRVQAESEIEENRRMQRQMAVREERNRQVLERAKQIVDVERVRLEREEQVARAKLRALEVDNVHKARRRETMRAQLEQEAREEKQNAEVLKALERKLKGDQSTDADTAADASEEVSPPPETETEETPAPVAETETEAPRKDSAQAEQSATSAGQDEEAKEKESRKDTEKEASAEGKDEGERNEEQQQEEQKRATPPTEGEPAAQDTAEAVAPETVQEEPASDVPPATTDETKPKEKTPVTKESRDTKSTTEDEPPQKDEETPTPPPSEPVQHEQPAEQQDAVPTEDGENAAAPAEENVEGVASSSSGSSSDHAPESDKIFCLLAAKRQVLGGSDGPVHPFGEASVALRSRGVCTRLSLLQGEQTPHIAALVRCHLEVIDPRQLTTVTGGSLLLSQLESHLPCLKMLSQFSLPETNPAAIPKAVTQRSMSVTVREGHQPGDQLMSAEMQVIEKAALSWTIPPTSTLEEIAQEAAAIQFRCSLLEVGTRTVELAVEKEGESMFHRSVALKIVGPLLRLEKTTERYDDVNLFPPLASLVVNKNPPTSLAGCTVQIQTSSDRLEEWKFVSGRFVFDADLGAIYDATDDDAVICRWVVEDRTLTLDFPLKGSLPPAVLEEVLHSVRRTSSEVGTQTFLVTIMTSAASSMETSCSMTVESGFTTPPLLPPLKEEERFYRPAPSAVLQLISNSDVNNVTSTLPLGSNVTVQLLHQDTGSDRLMLSAGHSKNDNCFFSPSRRRLAAVLTAEKHRISLETLVDCDSEEFRQLLSGLLFATNTVRFGHRTVRLELTTKTEQSSPLVRILKIAVGPPLLTFGKPTVKHVPLLQAQPILCSGWQFNREVMKGGLMALERIELKVTVNPLGLESTEPPKFAFALRAPFEVETLRAEGSPLLYQGRAVGSVSQPRPSCVDVRFSWAEVTHAGVSETVLTFLEAVARSIVVSLESCAFFRADIEVVDRTHGCRSSAQTEWVGYEASPEPTVILPSTELSYRQGSKAVGSGFSLFPGAQCILPPTRSFPSCDISVDLVGGGMGDGEDIVEWLASDHDQPGTQQVSTTSDEFAPPMVCATEGRLAINDVTVGSYEYQNMNSCVKITLRAPEGEDGLSGDTLAAILRAIAFRNSDAKIKAGSRLFSLRVQWSKEESLRKKVAVMASPILFAVPTFGAKVMSGAHALLPAICPKMIINMDDGHTIEPAVITVQIVRGVAWGMNEDRILLPTNSEFEVSGRSLTQQGVGPIASVTISEASLAVMVNVGVKLTGKSLTNLLRSFAYENTEFTTNTEPRLVEFCVEERNGDACYANVAVSLMSKELPAELQLNCTKIDYALTGQIAIVAPDAKISKCPALDPSPSLRVEFLQQHLPQDVLSLETNQQEGITISMSGATNAIAFGDPAETVGTFVKKGDHLSVHFNACASLTAIQAVIRSVSYAHSGRRDRQGTKKIQFSFCPKGKMFTRSSIAVQTHEASFDLSALSPVVLKGLSSPAVNIWKPCRLKSGVTYSNCVIECAVSLSPTPCENKTKPSTLPPAGETQHDEFQLASTPSLTLVTQTGDEAEAAAEVGRDVLDEWESLGIIDARRTVEGRNVKCVFGAGATVERVQKIIECLTLARTSKDTAAQPQSCTVTVALVVPCVGRSEGHIIVECR